MSEKKLNTTKEISKKDTQKIQKWMDRLKTVKKEYNPAPKESKK